MRVLIYGLNCFPELTGIGKYTGELAQWLADRGHDVDIVTAPPYYPEWKVWAGYSGLAYRTEAPQKGLTVTRCPIWVPQKLSGVARLVHLLSFAISSFPAIFVKASRRPDVVLTIAPTLFCALSGWLAARLFGAKAWLHIQDFEFDAAQAMGMLKSGRWTRLARGSECWTMRRFDRVSTISPRMMDRLSQKDIPLDRQRHLPNWADLESIFPLDDANGVRSSFGISPNQTVALYSGNIGEKQGLETLLDAAALGVGTNVEYLVCGTGAARQRLEERYGHLTNVRWLPLQPSDRLNDLLNAADIHVLPQRADVADLVMPSKLSGMLASGRPVVASAARGTQVETLLKNCGKVVPPGDPYSMASAIAELATNAQSRVELGSAARRAATIHFNKKSILARFEAELRNVVEDRAEAVPEMLGEETDEILATVGHDEPR